MRDVAALAGVSVKTVSNVVAGATVVRELTRAKVETAIDQLDFVPHLAARRLRKGRSGTISLVCSSLASELPAELMRHIVEVAHERGLAAQLEHFQPLRKRQNVPHSPPHAYDADGLILLPGCLDEGLPAYGERLPFVVIGDADRHRGDRVHIDSRVAGADAARHLLARGATRVAVIGADHASSLPAHRRSLDGVRDALREAGLAQDPALEVGCASGSAPTGAVAVRALLARNVAFDAIVVLTDSLAWGVLHALHESGIAVPDAVLVVGLEEGEASRFTTPALTTVAFDHRTMATLALNMLASRWDDARRNPRARTLPHELLERASTGRRPGGHHP